VDEAKDRDENRDVEAENNANNNLDEGEDSDIEANEQMATDGQDSANESANYLTVHTGE
jgi:hypothetical protein